MFHFTIKRRTPCVLFVMGLILRAGSAWGFNSPDYFPLTQGITWTYTTSTVTVSGTQDVNGVQTTVLQSTDGRKTWNTSDATSGIRLHQQFVPNVQGVNLTLTFSPPIVLATGSANVGDSVISPGTATAVFTPGGTALFAYTATFNVTGMPDVTVPAGTFANVVQLDGTIHLNGGTTTGGVPISPQDLFSTSYLALNIGAVKLSASASFGATTAELIASNILLPATLTNISTRARVQTGANVMIGGFIIGGDTPKTVLVRAIGPSLAAFGVPGALANPSLQLFSGQTPIAENDDWQVTDLVCQAIGCGGPADIAATGSAPSHPLEAAILITLNPGPYTAIVSGVGGTTGVGLVEVYEVP